MFLFKYVPLKRKSLESKVQPHSSRRLPSISVIFLSNDTGFFGCVLSANPYSHSIARSITYSAMLPVALNPFKVLHIHINCR